MIVIDARGFQGLEAVFSSLSREQLPYALKTAINNVAFEVMRAEKAAMLAAFDRPTPWLVRQVAVKPATKQDLTAVIGTPEGIRDIHGRNVGFGRSSSGVFERVLEPHIEGGVRLPKASEIRLRAAGVLPAGWFAIPGKDAPLNAYGNLSGDWWMMLLSWLNAGQWSRQGAIQNQAEKVTNRKNKLQRQGATMFAVIPNRGSGMKPGVYIRKAGKGGALKRVLLFVPSVNYRRRLDWFGVFDRTVRATLPDAAASAVRRALETAR